jgi:hypothetical protein
MSEPTRKRSSPPLTTLFIVTALAIFYPLSAGPAGWLFIHGYLPESAMVVADWFYGPLSWVSLHTTFFSENPIGQAYSSYIDWWNT